MKFRIWYSAKRQRHALDIEMPDEHTALECTRFMMWGEAQGAYVRLLRVETDPPDFQYGRWVRE